MPGLFLARIEGHAGKGDAVIDSYERIIIDILISLDSRSGIYDEFGVIGPVLPVVKAAAEGPRRLLGEIGRAAVVKHPVGPHRGVPGVGQRRQGLGESRQLRHQPRHVVSAQNAVQPHGVNVAAGIRPGQKLTGAPSLPAEAVRLHRKA